MPLDTPICYSGGAPAKPGFLSADLVFGEQAKKAGHYVCHYTFVPHYRNVLAETEDYIIISQEQLNTADPHLIEANRVLKRSFPTFSLYTNNLLRRNFFQIEKSDSVYSISSFNEKGIVKGGTAWAVYMAIQNKVPLVFLFDQTQYKCWYQWHYGENRWEPRARIVPPRGRYAGIGTREMNEFGEAAIKNLYETPKK